MHFWQNLRTLMSFQTCMNLFIVWIEIQTIVTVFVQIMDVSGVQNNTGLLLDNKYKRLIIF